MSYQRPIQNELIKSNILNQSKSNKNFLNLSCLRHFLHSVISFLLIFLLMGFIGRVWQGNRQVWIKSRPTSMKKLPKIILPEKWKILTPFQKWPKSGQFGICFGQMLSYSPRQQYIAHWSHWAGIDTYECWFVSGNNLKCKGHLNSC